MYDKAYEEVVTGHSWLPGDTGRDDDNVGALQGTLGTVVGGQEALDLGRRGNVGQIGCDLYIVCSAGSPSKKGRQPGAQGSTHTGSVDDIVERELGDERVELEEEGQRLADTTWSNIEVSVSIEGGWGMKETGQHTGSTTDSSFDHF